MNTVQIDGKRTLSPDLLKKISFPLVSQAELEAALTNLDQAVTGS